MRNTNQFTNQSMARIVKSKLAIGSVLLGTALVTEATGANAQRFDAKRANKAPQYITGA